MQTKGAILSIQENYDSFSESERKVANYILKSPMEAVDFTVLELAKASEVSESTVIRMCQHCGFSGYWPFRTMLAREVGAIQREDIATGESENLIHSLFNTYGSYLRNIGKNADITHWAEAISLIRNSSMVHLVATGNTGPIINHLNFRLGRLGIRSTANNVPEYFLNNIHLAEEGDVLLAVSQSGISKTVIQAAEIARSKGIKIIAITSYPDSNLGKLADVVLFSRGNQERFDYYKNYNHICELAVVDVLADSLSDRERIMNTNTDVLEILLSETKL